MKYPTLITSVAGVTFDVRQERIKEMHDGESVWFVLEPGNKYDPNAIAVLNSKGEHLGYIPRYSDKFKQIPNPMVKTIREAMEHNFINGVATIVGGHKKWLPLDAEVPCGAKVLYESEKWRQIQMPYGLRVEFCKVNPLYGMAKYLKLEDENDLPMKRVEKRREQKAKRHGKEYRDVLVKQKRKHPQKFTYHEIEAIKERRAG